MTTVPDPLITSTEERLGGTPVFAGTRVPVKTLFEYLEMGKPLDEFLDHFPDVDRAHAAAAIKLARQQMLDSVKARVPAAE